MMATGLAQEVADGTPLLTTLVQSGAALVAIIAGLLVARLVALVGERVALERKLQELNEIERQREEELSAARQTRLDSDADDFLLSLLDDFLKHPKRTFDDLYNEFSDGVRTADELRPYFEKFRNDVQRVAQELETHELARRTKLSNWEVRKSTLLAPYRLLERDIAERLLTKVETVWWERDQPTLPGGIVDLSPEFMTVIPPNNTAYLRDLRRDETNAETALKATCLELAQTRRALNMVSRPQGLGWTLLALGVVTIASVVVPLVRLTFGKPFLTVAARAGFVGIFVLSLLIFFGYLVYEMWRIMRRP